MGVKMSPSYITVPFIQPIIEGRISFEMAFDGLDFFIEVCFFAMELTCCHQG